MHDFRIKIAPGFLKRLEAAAAADDRTVNEALLVDVRTWVEAVERRQVTAPSDPRPTTTSPTRTAPDDPEAPQRNDGNDRRGKHDRQ